MTVLQQPQALSWESLLPPAPLPPLEQNTTTLQQAIAQGTVGVGYSGSGLLLFYFIGVSKILQQLGVIKPGTTKVAATSGGIIGCAPDFGIVDHATFLKVGKDFVARCRAKHNCAGTLDAEVARVVDMLLPPDAHKTVNETAYIMYAHPDERGAPIGDYVNIYESRQDLADAIRTGTFVPMWSAPSMTRPFRGKRAYDGGFRRALPCPPDVTYCVTASVLPPLNLNDMLRSLLEADTMRILGRALRSTLGSKPWQFVQKMFSMNRNAGYKVDEVLLGVVAYLRAIASPNGKDMSIYPGKYNPNPYPIWEWITMLLTPPDSETIDKLVAMGEADATAWAREQGLMPAA